MSVRLYMDVHIPRAIVYGLRMRGVDVLRAQDDKTERLPDPELLDRASALGCLLFTFDDDLLAEADRRQQSGVAFSGGAYAHPLNASIGECVRDLELIAKAGELEDHISQVVFPPFRRRGTS